jgi:hypothetical protein
MRSYWLDLFTGSTWQEFLDAGGGVSGFRERRWRTVQQIKPGDYLLCYLTGISRWIGLLEVTSAPFEMPRPSGRMRISRVGCESTSSWRSRRTRRSPSLISKTG